MPGSHFNVGDGIRADVQFYDSDGIQRSPSVVTADLVPPHGPKITLTDPDELAIGLFRFEYDPLDREGTWRLKVYGTGDLIAAEPISFYVAP